MEELDVGRLTKVYIRMREEKARLTKDYEAKIAAIDVQQEAVEAKLLEHCEATNAKSIKTEHGTVIRQEKTKYWAADWEAFGNYIVSNNAPHLLEKRIAQLAMKEHIESLPVGAVLPPSLQADRRYTVVIRKPS